MLVSKTMTLKSGMVKDIYNQEAEAGGHEFKRSLGYTARFC